jgi:hypothetical protein
MAELESLRAANSRPASTPWVVWAFAALGAASPAIAAVLLYVTR